VKTPRSPIRLLLLAGLAAATAACGAGAISETELESQVATELAAETGQDEPNIDCPGDLDAEVGATTTCELTVDGDDTVLPVMVEVTSIEDGTANYSVEVGEPEGGTESDAGNEDPVDPAPVDEAPEDGSTEESTEDTSTEDTTTE
jgi:ABC-type phosphate transport system substrate-binding protein